MAFGRLKTTLEIGAKLDGSVNTAFDKLKNEQKQLTKAIADSKLEQKALRVEMRGLKRGSPELAKLKSRYDSLGDSIKRDELRVIGLQRAQNKMGRSGVKSVSKLRMALGRVGSGFAKLGKFAAGAGVAIGGAMVGAFHGISRVAERLDKVGKTSQALGVSTAALQELRFAAQLSGMESEQFDTAFQRMTRRIGQGSKATTDALEAMGLSFEELRKLSPEEQFQQVAQAASGIGDAGQRLAVLTKIFDTEGARGMAVMLGEGAAGLEAMREQARSAGAVISGDAIKASADFNDEMLKLKTTATGTLSEIAGKLMPDVINMFKGATVWIRENQDMLRSTALSIAELGSVVLKVSAVVAGFAAGVAELAGGWHNLGIVATAFWVAMKTAALTNPIGMVLVGIGTAIALITANWDKFVGALKWSWNNVLHPYLSLLREQLNAVLWVWNKITGMDVKIPELKKFDTGGAAAATQTLPATQAAGSAPMSAQQAMSTAPAFTINNNISASVAPEELKAATREATLDMERQLRSSSLWGDGAAAQAGAL